MDRIEARLQAAAADPAVLGELLSVVGPARVPQDVREESAAVLKLLARRVPGALAARQDEILALLDSDNAFTRMAMVHVVAGMATGGASPALEIAVSVMLNHMSDDKVSVAGHVFKAAGEIAQARPELRERITARILELPNVAARPERIGLLRSYAIEALDAYLAPEARTAEIIAFVCAGLEDDSPKTRKLAADTLRQWGIAAASPRR